MPPAHSRNREAERELIKALTDDFIESGGEIKQVGYLVTASPSLSKQGYNQYSKLMND